MKKSKSNLNGQDSKINELMSSIQSKLQLLAKDQFDSDFQLNPSHPASLNYQMISPNKSVGLEFQHSSIKSQIGSPILSRISQIQQKYLSKLTVLNQKTTILQNENNELRVVNRKLQKQLDQERQKLKLIEVQQQRILDRKVDQMKDSLLNRMKEEVESEVEGYMRQLSQMRQQIGRQRLERKKIQKEIQLVRFQRNNFEQMYMEIMNKFKQLMQSEVSSYQKQVNPRIQNTMQTNRLSQDKMLYQQKYKQELKKKQKVKRKKTAQMPKQKLIPYLAKGIDQLKQKLNLK